MKNNRALENIIYANIHANTQASTHYIFITVYSHTTYILLCCYNHYIIITSCSDNLMHVGHVLCDNKR